MKKTVFTIIIVFCIGFVFTNSLMPRSVSKNESSKVTQFITKQERPVDYDSWTAEKIVRKAAHFTEFGILGALFVVALPIYGKKIKGNIIYPMFFGLSVAVCDEALQLISDRGSQVRDVLLDFSGVVFGIFVTWFFINLYKRRQVKK